MSINLNEDILLNVEKPARYVGNEWNMVKKVIDNVKVRFAFCFPDVYEIGMSNLGMEILYYVINKREEFYCERVFAPWIDMEEMMRDKDIPLFSLETHSPINEFDFIGFTLQYEMSYTNILNMIDLAKIPVLAKDRDDSHPIVCAGGPCAFNPEPLCDFIDFFVLGDGENIVEEIFDKYIELKETGISRNNILKELALIEGVYVPCLYDVEYNVDNTIKSIIPCDDKIPEKIKKRVEVNLDNTFYPDRFLVPNIEVVHGRMMIELFRGCIHGCRFCQAGFTYRPVRERTHENLVNTSKELYKNTGYEEISLVSLSTGDYSELKQLTDKLTEFTETKGVNISLPSLRVNSFSLELMRKAQKVRKGGLTFAPEAGSQRLRNVINKNISEEDLLNSIKVAIEGGWYHIKLYFMLGLPTETDEDILGIVNLAYRIIDMYREVSKGKRQKKLAINLSTSSFVPKVFTPFQWDKQDSITELKRKQDILKDKLKNKMIKYSWHEANISYIEALVARGDRRVGKVIKKAWEKGCKFDSWAERFNLDKWMEAVKEENIDIDFYTNREKSYDEILPWEHIDIGVTKEYLINEREKAYKGEITDNCRDNCSGCGVSVYKGGICFE